METQILDRGRLIDHVQLVVKDLDASYRFYAAVFETIGIPIGGHVRGRPLLLRRAVRLHPDQQGRGGRAHGPRPPRVPGRDRAMVERFHAAALASGGTDNGAPGERAPIIPATTEPSCSTRTATISRSCITEKPSDRPKA